MPTSSTGREARGETGDGEDDRGRRGAPVGDGGGEVTMAADKQIALARAIARSFNAPLSAREDLVQAGIVGFLDAVPRFDARRGISLRGFARFRMRGAMLDYMRSADPVDRGTRARIKRGERPEISHIPLTREGRGEEYIAGAGESPEDASITAERAERVRAALSVLTDRQRRILHEYYWGGRCMREIGAGIGVGENRVSQIHSAILVKLRAALRAKDVLASRILEVSFEGVPETERNGGSNV